MDDIVEGNAVPSNHDSALVEPCVVVIREQGAQPSEVSLKIVELNGIDSFAVPTLLRAAANMRENQLGVR